MRIVFLIQILLLGLLLPLNSFSAEAQIRDDGLSPPLCPAVGQAPQLVLTASDPKLVEFLKLVADSNSKLLMMDFNLSSNIAGCASQETKLPMCDDMIAFVNDEFRPMVKAARLHLALSRGVDPKSGFDNPIRGINAKLLAAGLKSTPWDPLTQDEEKRVRAIERQEFEKDLRDFESEARKMDSVRGNEMSAEIERRVAIRRNAHLLAYYEIMDRYPIIQFLHSSEVPLDEIQMAAAAVRNNINSRGERIMRIKENLSSESASIWWSEIVPLIASDAAVSMVVEDRPEHCEVYRGLKRIRAYRKLAKDIAVSGAMAVAFFTGPIIGTGLVLGANAWSLWDVHQNYLDASEDLLRSVLERKGISLKRIDEIKSEENVAVMGLAVAPVSMGVAGRIFRLARQQSQSFLAITGFKKARGLSQAFATERLRALPVDEIPSFKAPL